MKSYRVFAEANSYSILPKDLIMDLNIQTAIDKIMVRIQNQNAMDLIGKEFSKCLSIITEIEANDIDEAVGKCYSYSNEILDKIAFEVGMPVDKLKIFKAYELVELGEDVEMINFDYEVLDKIGSKALNLSRFNQIVEKCKSDRINRALHWYRRALNEADLLDIFSYIWISLEVLTPLFIKKYPDAIEISKCKQCGHEEEIKNTAALKMFFKIVLDDEKLYSRARSIRVGIQHGHKDLADIQKEISEIIDKLEIACRKAIVFVLELDINAFEYANGIANNESITFVSILKISNFITDEASPDYFEPEIKVEIDIKEENGAVIIKPTLRTNILDHRCSLAGLSWDFYGGDTGYPIKKIQLRIAG